MAAAGDQSICSGGLRLGRPELKARPECGDLWWWMGRGLEQVTVVRRRDRQNWPGRGADGKRKELSCRWSGGWGGPERPSRGPWWSNWSPQACLQTRRPHPAQQKNSFGFNAGVGAWESGEGATENAHLVTWQLLATRRSKPGVDCGTILSLI